MPIVPSITPYLIVSDAKSAIDFYCKAMGAVESFRLVDPTDGRIGHAELKFGDSTVMLADEYPDFGALCPDTVGGSPVTFVLSTETLHADLERLTKAGVTVLRGPADESFGERAATILDPYGHLWTLSQNIEDVSPEEMQRRWNEETNA